MAVHPMTTTTALLHTLRVETDGQAWSDFVDRYSPILKRVARRVGLSEDDAADAAQQTLLEFVRDMRAGQFDRSRGRLRSWILAIAEHRSRDIQRRRARNVDHARGFDRALAHDVEDRLRRMEAWWAEEEQAHIAGVAWDEERAVSGTDSSTLRAFELVGIRQVPATEAARELGMSVDAIYAAKYRIAQRLRERIERLSVCYQEDRV